MSGIRIRTGAAGAVLGSAALALALGFSMSHADEPKAPKPPTPEALPKEGKSPFSADLKKAQEQMFRAVEALAKDPNDAEARKQLDEARAALMKALASGANEIPRPGPGFLGFGLGRASDRARLGVQLEPLTPLVADQLSLDPNSGIAVAGVLEGSAAAKSGFKVHDVVIEFAGKPVSNDPRDFTRQVNAVKPGEKVNAVVVRKGKKVELKGIELPAPEVVPQPEAQRLPTNPKALENNKAGDSVSVSINNGKFVVKATQSGVDFVITGQVGTDGATADKVTIKSGDETIEAASLDKVPEKYRPTVEKLLKNVGPSRAKVRD